MEADFDLSRGSDTLPSARTGTSLHLFRMEIRKKSFDKFYLIFLEDL